MTNQRKCTCTICNAIIQKNEGLKIYNKNRYGYICTSCQTSNQGKNLITKNVVDLGHSSASYSTENTQVINNTTKTNQCTISIELEVPRRAVEYQLEENFKWLVNQGFYATYDCTVWKEFKSPIYNNLLGLSKTLNHFEKLNKLNLWNNDNSYGTHCNIGNTIINADTISILKRFYHSLFLDYSNYLLQNTDKCKKLYGRTLGGWADAISSHTEPTNHCNFINLQHNTHIEFRINKLISARQYLLATRLNQDIVQKVICDYFLKNFSENNTASKNREYAKKASQKMIKLFNKYYEKLIQE
jgi:hypothetical protein